MKLVWKYAGLPASNSASEKNHPGQDVHISIFPIDILYIFFYTDRLGLDLMLLARWPLCSLRSNIHGLAWSQIWRIPEFSEYLYVLLQLSFDIFSPQKTSYIIRLFKLQTIRNLCKKNRVLPKLTRDYYLAH